MYFFKDFNKVSNDFFLRGGALDNYAFNAHPANEKSLNG